MSGKNFMRDSEFEFIRTLVYEHSRIHLSPDKRELVASRFGKRLRATQLSNISEYCQLLQGRTAGDELAHLIDAISTNHTFFFREMAHFDFLRHTVLPEMIQRNRVERWPRFDVWSAASSSGEEPYSIAMTLAEHLSPSSVWPWHVQATDISHRILEEARAAIYRADVVERLPAAQVLKYFQKGIGPQEGNFRVKPVLTSGVTYHQLNLLEGEPPFRGPFQLIFCRNVMIYFDRATQEELIQRLTQRLVPGGYLFVGHSESLTAVRHSLQTVKPAIYRRPPAS